MDAAASSTDWLTLTGSVVGIAGGIAGLVTFFLRYANPADKVERWADEDPEYRRELASELKGKRFGGLYRDTLDRALDWLDRRFGPADSSKALGICIIIALSYAYAAFFLAWGIGGPGDIGGVELLSERDSMRSRLPLAVSFVAGVPLAFLFGRRLGRLERQVRVHICRLLHWPRLHFHTIYARVFSIVFVIPIFAASFYVPLGMYILASSIMFLLSSWIVIGASDSIQPHLPSSYSYLSQRLNTAFVGVFAGMWVSFFSLIVTDVLSSAPTEAVAIALASSISIAVYLNAMNRSMRTYDRAMLIFVIASLASMLAAALANLNASVGVGAGAGAGAAVGATIVGFVNGVGRREGTFASTIGGIAGFGIATLLSEPIRASKEFGVVFVLIFLIVPLVNGLWDWLSLWVSRRLGQHLLTKLSPKGSTRSRVATVTWHALADLGAAAFLLGAIAYLLAFGFAAYNQIAMALSEEARGVLELEPFIERAATAAWTDGLWLTVMLISTLVPTFLHLIMLLASPMMLVALPTEKRLALAADLETYGRQPDRQATIRRRAGQYVAREKHGALALATFLLVLLLSIIGWLVNLIHQGGLPDYVLEVARAGIRTARWMASVF